jgi:hypothetical protein
MQLLRLLKTGFNVKSTRLLVLHTLSRSVVASDSLETLLKHFPGWWCQQEHVPAISNKITAITGLLNARAGWGR